MSSVSPSLSPKGAFGIRGPLGTVPAWLGLLGFLHAVGLTGVALYDANLVLDLTVFNLLLSAAVILVQNSRQGQCIPSSIHSAIQTSIHPISHP